MRISDILRAWRISGSTVLAELFGGLMRQGPDVEPLTTLTYGPTIAIDASLGNLFVVTITDAVAFVVGAPTNTPPTGRSQVIAITFRNGSGGAHGAGTYNAVFKTSGNVPAIANGFSRTFAYQWDGTNWVQTLVPATDVAN